MDQALSDGPGLSLREIVHASQRHFLLALGVLVAGSLLCVRYVLQMNDVYKSTAGTYVPASSDDASGGDFLTYARAIAFSAPVLEKALVLADDADRSMTNSSNARLPRGFEIRVDGSIIYFDVTDTEGERATRLANAWANVFVAAINEELDKTAVFEQKLRKEWLEKSEALAACEADSGFKVRTTRDSKDVSLHHPLIDDIAEAKRRISKLDLEMQTLQVESEVLEKTGASVSLTSLTKIRAHPEALQLISERQQLSADLEKQRGIDPDKDLVRTLERKLAQNQEFANKLVAHVLADVKMERDLKILEIEKLSSSLKKMQMALDMARKKADRISDLYVEEYAARLAYERVLGGRDARKVKTPVIYQTATTSSQPFKIAARMQFLVAGILFTLAVAIGLAVLRERMDDTAHSGRIITQHFRMLPIGFVPLDITRVSETLSRVGVGEELLRIYHTITAGHDGDKPVIVTCTSAQRGAGKTFITFGFGQCASAIRKRILLIDADSSSPSLSSALGLQPTSGSSQQDWSKRVVAVRQDVSLLNIAGFTVDRASAETLFSELKTRFDLIVVDAPDLFSSASSAMLSSISDATLLICRSRVTPILSIRSSLDTLSTVKAQRVAVVLNGLDKLDLTNESRS